MLRSLTRLFAASLVLALGACKARPMGGTQAEADTATAAGTATQPDTVVSPFATKASAIASPKPPADSCGLRQALETWSDSAPAERRYAVLVAVQLARMEVVSAPRPKPGEAPAVVDSAAANRACRAARQRDFNTFVTAYRDVNRTTVLDEAFVGKLTILGRQLATSTDASANAPPRTGEVTALPDSSPEGGSPPEEIPIVNRVEVPWEWLAALIAFVAVTALALGYALWRLGGSIDDSRQRQYDHHQRQQSQAGGFRDEIVRSVRTVQDEVSSSHKTTRAEIANAFARVGTEMAMLRESVARTSGGTAGTVPPPTGFGESRRAAGGEFLLEDDPYGHAQWEETTVDVRPADTGSSAIQADTLGVFTLRWAHGSDAEARLSVNPSRALSAAHRDKLAAAFRSQGPSRATGRYHTVEQARCTWDPSTGQGRIIHPGVVEEV